MTEAPNRLAQKPTHPVAVVLVGHGGVPADYPRERVRRLMTLEARRQAEGSPMTEEERQLDAELRNHPRTDATDPYQAGLEQVAAVLRSHLPEHRVSVAYNEFCAPSVPDAVEEAIASGAREVVLLSSMMTPGGSHSEVEIPALVDELRARYRGAVIRYAWPFDLHAIAELMAAQVARFAAAEAAE